MIKAGDDRLTSLLGWKHQLDEELQELRARQCELGEAIAHKEGQLRNLRELLDSEGYAMEDARGEDRPPNGSIGDAAFALIKEIGQPVYYKELAERLGESGVTIRGRDPGANLISHLARDRRFARVARGTYALSEWGLRPKKKGRAPRKQKATRGRGRTA